MNDESKIPPTGSTHRGEDADTKPKENADLMNRAAKQTPSNKPPVSQPPASPKQSPKR